MNIVERVDSLKIVNFELTGDESCFYRHLVARNSFNVLINPAWRRCVTVDVLDNYITQDDRLFCLFRIEFQLLVAMKPYLRVKRKAPYGDWSSCSHVVEYEMTDKKKVIAVAVSDIVARELNAR